jgi:magnesium transporter
MDSGDFAGFFVQGIKRPLSWIFKNNSAKKGMAPGQVVHVGEKKVEDAVVTVIDYDEENCSEFEVKDLQDILKFKDSDSVTWINIDGIHDTGLVENIGECFGLHPLVMEDIVNTTQRPKVEYFDNYIYMVVKMLIFDEKRHITVSEQVSLVLGKNFVLSFQEQKGDVFEPVRNRIRNGKGRVRKGQADYLAYVLLDAVVDGYFSVIEKISDIMDAMDSVVFENPSPRIPHAIQRLRTEIMLIRKSVWPIRESIGSFQRMESGLVDSSLKPYLSDLYDHVIQVADTTDMLRDMLASLRDTYLSSISNKMNEVMKVLTIIATIFIPITFVAGIYGMNFEYMPELKFQYGYFYVLGFMGAMVLGMLVYFRRKGWL